MAFEKCKRCGFMHYSTDPCKESTAALREVPRPSATHPSAGKQRAGRSVSDKRIMTPPLGTAGTQALPVDTPKPLGRPRIHPDRKAYKAQHERDRRAKLKASKGE